MPNPNFQYQVRSSFWGPKRLVFSSVPTQGKMKSLQTSSHEPWSTLLMNRIPPTTQRVRWIFGNHTGDIPPPLENLVVYCEPANISPSLMLLGASEKRSFLFLGIFFAQMALSWWRFGCVGATVTPRVTHRGNCSFCSTALCFCVETSCFAWPHVIINRRRATKGETVMPLSGQCNHRSKY